MKKALSITVFSLALGTSIHATEWKVWDASVGNGHYYAVTDGSAMTWFDAQGAATDAGGYLTSIGSLEELNFIRTTFGRSELFWTGLSTINGNGHYEWDSGEPVTFTYFGAHQPDTSQLSAVVINSVNARGFTRGSFLDVNLDSTPLYRGIIERNTDPNGQFPSVPDGGSTLALLGMAVMAAGTWRTARR